MSGVCLITKGMVCSGGSRAPSKCVLPLKAAIVVKQSIYGTIVDKTKLVGTIRVCS